MFTPLNLLITVCVAISYVAAVYILALFFTGR